MISYKNEIISLKDNLEKTTTELGSVKAELEQTTSALVDKTKALEKLNASVNAAAEELPTMQEGLAKCHTPAERVAFLTSGKYVR